MILGYVFNTIIVVSFSSYLFIHIRNIVVATNNNISKLFLMELFISPIQVFTNCSSHAVTTSIDYIHNI